MDVIFPSSSQCKGAPRGAPHFETSIKDSARRAGRKRPRLRHRRPDLQRHLVFADVERHRPYRCPGRRTRLLQILHLSSSRRVVFRCRQPTPGGEACQVVHHKILWCTAN